MVAGATWSRRTISRSTKRERRAGSHPRSRAGSSTAVWSPAIRAICRIDRSLRAKESSSGSEDMSASDPYLLGYRQSEQRRLERQAQELGSESAWLFDQIGVRDGWRVVEIGCGPWGCLGLLSERVGAAGRVVGVERSEEQALRAREIAAEKRLANVEVLHADARDTGLPSGSVRSRDGAPRARERPAARDDRRRDGAPRPAGRRRRAARSRLVERSAATRPTRPRRACSSCSRPTRSERHRPLASACARRACCAKPGSSTSARNPLVHVYPRDHSRRMLRARFRRERAGADSREASSIAEAELAALTAALKSHLEDPANAGRIVALHPGVGAQARALTALRELRVRGGCAVRRIRYTPRRMIRIDGISKRHGGQILFLEASAAVNRGEKVGLVGPNGSGKTTIFRMITHAGRARRAAGSPSIAASRSATSARTSAR